MRIVGIVLTGGKSTRMGRPKALLELGGHTFLRLVLRALAEAGIPECVVVTGEHDREIRVHLAQTPPTPRLDVQVATNLDPAGGQLSSLLVALDAIGNGADAVIVALVDHPGVRATTVRALLDTFAATGAPVVRPAFGGRRGHPVVFARETFAALRASPLAGGARPVVHALGARVLDLDVDDPAVIEDIDTPEAYERVRAARGEPPEIG